MKAAMTVNTLYDAVYQKALEVGKDIVGEYLDAITGYSITINTVDPSDESFLTGLCNLQSKSGSLTTDDFRDYIKSRFTNDVNTTFRTNIMMDCLHGRVFMENRTIEIKLNKSAICKEIINNLPYIDWYINTVIPITMKHEIGHALDYIYLDGASVEEFTKLEEDNKEALLEYYAWDEKRQKELSEKKDATNDEIVAYRLESARRYYETIPNEARANALVELSIDEMLKTVIPPVKGYKEKDVFNYEINITKPSKKELKSLTKQTTREPIERTRRNDSK